jgi:hypothetical protein
MTRTTLLPFLPLVAAAVRLSWRHYRNAKALLQDWANANGLRILHAKQSWSAMPPSTGSPLRNTRSPIAPRSTTKPSIASVRPGCD